MTRNRYDNKVLDTMKQLLEVLREAVNSDDGEDNEVCTDLTRHLALETLIIHVVTFRILKQFFCPKLCICPTFFSENPKHNSNIIMPQCMTLTRVH